MNRCTYTSDFVMDQDIDNLFPLFSPEGEKKWVPDWDYINIMERTELQEDDVFLTRTHDHAAADAIWLVKQFDPDEYFIQFYKIEPEEKIGLVTVQCYPLGDQSTKVQVSYTYTSLSEKGNEFVRNFSENDYLDFIQEWQKLLLDYFARSE